MTASRSIEVSPGITWETMSDGALANSPIVCVPINDIVVMTDEQVGALARKAVRAARMAYAANMAANINHETRLKVRPVEILNRIPFDTLTLLQEFAGEDGEIDRAITVLAIAAAEQNAKEVIARSKQAKRAEIAADYNNLFVAIGRRDGFCCQSCQDAPSDLQIDHITPVSKGGSNGLDNLQLLCPTCNIVKGARI